MVRVVHAWRALEPERRLAAIAAIALFVTMLLPWYTKSDTVVVKGTLLRPTETTFSAFGAFSFVEAAVLLVSAGVLVMLFARAEGRAFHLPGGDGTIIMLAGSWAAILIFIRLFAKPGLKSSETISATEGVTWGIFIALLTALALAYAGWRVRAAARPEPPLVFDEPPPAPAPRPEARPAPSEPEPEPEPEVTADRPRREARRERFPPAPASARPGGRPILTREDAAQLSFDDPHDVASEEQAGDSGR